MASSDSIDWSSRVFLNRLAEMASLDDSYLNRLAEVASLKDSDPYGRLIADSLSAARQLLDMHAANPTTQVTASARELVASLLQDTPMYAVLHISEPTPTDPLATVVVMSGSYVVPITWSRNGAILTNATPLNFAGIADLTSVNWVAVSLNPDGTNILFSGEVEEPETSSAEFEVFVVPAGAIELIVA